MASAEQYSEIKEKFGGSWKMDRSENFEDFLREVGVNFFVRKMANLSKPQTDIVVEDGKITVTMNAGFMKKCDSMVLGEEFDTEFQGQKVKAKTRYEDGKLISDNKPVDENIKGTTSTRQIMDDGELLLTLTIGDVVCKRWFKKLPPAAE